MLGCNKIRGLLGLKPADKRQEKDSQVIETKEKVSVLFVCMGNICRSPTAEGVFRKVVSDAGLDAHIRVDSAGTHAYHINEPPDRRARAAAERRGFVLNNIRARRVIDEDFEHFDYILAMDEDNLLILRDSAPEHQRSKISLFLEFAGPGRELEVPDPYYGGAVGFERVLDLVEEASRGLLETLKRESGFD
ncbi:MAG: low molecular weight phosphotyrosine protein phosphatase [Proteobacteria bacterium]|nr:low molecular weight phosphotyrosine protein phosphatase [Pseudomonadota bacterium]